MSFDGRGYPFGLDDYFFIYKQSELLNIKIHRNKKVISANKSILFTLYLFGQLLHLPLKLRN